MTDLACQFGEGKRLKGVISRSTQSASRNGAFVLISAGFTSKIGPYRLYVDLSRSLADLGLTTLRFDLGGIGSSQTLDPDQPLPIRTAADIKDALDYLQDHHDIQHFVIGGLCSGAEDAFRYALEDQRVRGVLLIDPHAYVTKAWRIKKILSRAYFNRVVYKLLRVFQIITVVSDENRGAKAEGFEGSLIDYQYMKKKESAGILAALIQRGTKLHYIYTGGRSDKYNHKNQFYKMFEGIDFQNCVTLDYLPHIEHVQDFDEDREELVSVISRRLVAAYLGDDSQSIH